MKLLIQHCHKPEEISGVLTYVNYTISELQNSEIEARSISTQDSIWQWITSILWADIVHMNSNHLGFAILCKVFAKKIVIKYHYLFYLSINSKYEKTDFLTRLKIELISYLPKKYHPLKWKLYAIVKVLKLIVRYTTALLADKHIACSYFLAESNAFPWTVDTIYNPVKVLVDDYKKDLNFISHPNTFIFVGRLDRQKGVDILLHAVALLKNCQKDFQIIIVGGGSESQKLNELAIELDISKYVKFMGKQPHEEVLNLLRSALALIVPSRWQDPAPYVVLEAASVQTCSIVTRMGGLPEVAGPHNLIIEPEDPQVLAESMKYYLENPEKAIERGIQSQQYVIDKFSASVTIAQTIQACQEVRQIKK